jgi:DegV family protein with EDD domain
VIHILTDSTSDLSQELVDRFHIDTIPLNVHIRDQAYKDGQTITTPRLFELVEANHELPKTAAPSVADFQAFFDREGESIFISISTQLSATLQSATLARDATHANVRLIDSRNLSTGIGMLAVRAAEMRDQGCSADEIEAAVLSWVPKVQSSFVVDTLDYLYMGGRCSAVQSIVSSLLKIRPVIEVKPDGTLGIKDKTRGSRKKALQSMLDDFARHLDAVDLRRIFITHTVCPQDAEYLKAEITRLCQPDEICITNAGSVIASHCGPNTIGILYMLK